MSPQTHPRYFLNMHISTRRSSSPQVMESWRRHPATDSSSFSSERSLGLPGSVENRSPGGLETPHGPMRAHDGPWWPMGPMGRGWDVVKINLKKSTLNRRGQHEQPEKVVEWNLRSSGPFETGQTLFPHENQFSTFSGKSKYTKNPWCGNV